ncbi:MauE/DoxX family redox-associated membrane protein [Yunchengibacter salinarum]|uniref:MauE/DoxX family redox-associated membrane protein n=1 Tax=Yunchengibacter salinarum TaxID=3133399 RepID=UPI0035B5F3EE
MSGALASVAVDPALVLIAGLAVAALFAVAAWHKASDPVRFEGVLQGYGVASARGRWLLARLLPAVEALVPVLLVWRPGPGFALGAGLFALFGVAMAAALVQGRRDLDCGCGGPMARQTVGWGLVARNAILTVIAGAMAVLPVVDRGLTPWDAGLALLVLGALWSLSLAAGGLAGNAGRLKRLRALDV